MRASIQLKPQTKIYRTRAGTHTRTHHTHHIHTIHHSHTHTPGKHFALDSLVSPEDKHAVGDLSSQRQPVLGLFCLCTRSLLSILGLFCLCTRSLLSLY